MAINPNIKKKADDIRNKVYGKEVRESLASGLEAMSSDVVENEGRQSVVENRQDSVESQWQNVIDETTNLDVVSAPEIIAARGGHSNLSQRLLSTDQQLTDLTFPSPPEPTFVILDDDATVGVPNTLEPILDSYGIKGNIAVITSRLDEGGWYLGRSHVKRLYDKGWNVLSHTHTHARLPDETENSIRSEMLQSKNALKDIGIDAKHIVYPTNAVDDKVARIAKDYYQSGISAYNFTDDDTSGINKSPISTYNMTRIGIGAWGISDLVRIKRIIDATIEINGLLIFMTHVGENTEEHNDELREIIEYVLSKGYTFDTYEDAFEKHKNVIEQGEYRVDNNAYDFAIGKNGNMNMRGLRMRKLNANAISSETNPRFFGLNSDTYCEITSSNATGFPTENAGIAHTIVQGGELSSRVYGTQFYNPYGSLSIYRRDALTLTSWGDWKKQTDEMVEKPLFNAPPGDYSIGNNTFNYQTGDVDVEGIVGGTLTTVRPSYAQGYTYQIHQQYGQPNLFIRTQKANQNEWGEFQEVVTKPLYEKLPFDALASEYNVGTTVEHYTGGEVSGADTPNGRTGTLTTVKPSQSNLLYSYQIFKEFGENLLYFRSWRKPTADPAAWSEWKEL